MHKVQKWQKWRNYAQVAKKDSENRKLSNEHLLLFFRGYRYAFYRRTTNGYAKAMFGSPHPQGGAVEPNVISRLRKMYGTCMDGDMILKKLREK